MKMQRDRYVAREAGATEGTLTTKLLTLDAAKMTVNADAAKGSVAVGLLMPPESRSPDSPRPSAAR